MDIETLRVKLAQAQAAREAAEKTEREIAKELASETARAWVMVVDRHNKTIAVRAVSNECANYYGHLRFEGRGGRGLVGNEAFGVGYSPNCAINLHPNLVDDLEGLVLVTVKDKPTPADAAKFYNFVASWKFSVPKWAAYTP